MSILLWVLLGALSGWIASKLMGLERNGCLTNIVLGIIGGFLGGLLVGLLGGTGVTGFNLWSIFVSVLGAVALIWVVTKIKKK